MTYLHLILFPFYSSDVVFHLCLIVSDLVHVFLNCIELNVKVAPYSLVQFINYLYRSATSDVILTTFAWNFRGSGNILKQARKVVFEFFYAPKHGNSSLFLEFFKSQKIRMF